MWTSLFATALLVDIINIPYDNGANKIGSRYAYKQLEKDLKFLPIDNEYIINANNHCEMCLVTVFQKYLIH